MCLREDGRTYRGTEGSNAASCSRDCPAVVRHGSQTAAVVDVAVGVVAVFEDGADERSEVPLAAGVRIREDVPSHHYPRRSPGPGGTDPRAAHFSACAL